MVMESELLWLFEMDAIPTVLYVFQRCTHNNNNNTNWQQQQQQQHELTESPQW